MDVKSYKQGVQILTRHKEVIRSQVEDSIPKQPFPFQEVNMAFALMNENTFNLGCSSCAAEVKRQAYNILKRLKKI